MATAKHLSHPVPRRTGSRRRILALAGLGLLIIFATYWAAFGGKAKVAAAYDARIACACRYIAGRYLAQCHDDLMAGGGPIRLSEDAEAKSITAWLPLLARQTARYEDGPGCLLEPWQR